ncbi:MAG: hypothetical protein V4487_07830 [Chlamydiota bacterium]
MSFLSSDTSEISPLMESCPCSADWPDDLHWETISYLAPVENNGLSDNAIHYILTVTRASHRSIEEFLKTYNGRDSFRIVLRNWQFSRIQQLSEVAQEEYVDSDDEKEILEQSAIHPAIFQELPPQTFALNMQNLARSANWKTVEQMIASGRRIPPNTYCGLIEEAAIQGERGRFETLLKKRPQLNYEKLISIFRKHKVRFDAYGIIQKTNHYAKMSQAQKQRLASCLRRG